MNSDTESWIDKRKGPTYNIPTGGISHNAGNDGKREKYRLERPKGTEEMTMEKKSEQEQVSCCQCSGKQKERDEKERRDLINRLRRIEGQVRGIENMVERNAYCTDVLIQVSAVTSALNSFNKVLLANHVRTCVAENIRGGNDEVIEELLTVIQKMM